jgi:AcrR family transcriptional regulator
MPGEEKEPTSRDRQREERRQQILDRSLDMIISRGYEATRIRDIADSLHISIGLFFNYFESKEAIYEELVKIGLSGPESALAFNVEGADPLALFGQMTTYIFEALKSYSFTAKMFLLMAQAMRTESAPEGVKRLIASLDYVTPLVAVVQRGQDLGEIKPGDPVALILAYWGAVQGVAETHAVHPELPLPESRWIVDIVRK